MIEDMHLVADEFVYDMRFLHPSIYIYVYIYILKRFFTFPDHNFYST